MTKLLQDLFTDKYGTHAHTKRASRTDKQQQQQQQQHIIIIIIVVVVVVVVFSTQNASNQATHLFIQYIVVGVSYERSVVGVKELFTWHLPTKHNTHTLLDQRKPTLLHSQICSDVKSQATAVTRECRNLTEI